MPVRKVTEVGAQIARGLAAAHEKGIIHRDLKPDNIFITRDGRVKILDFGLAKLYLRDSTGLEVTSGPTLASKTTPGMVMGTIGYMSPEQVRGQELDHRTDIFSFGTIFYEMITGKRAFEGKTSADTMSAILKDGVSELSDSNRNVPPALDRIARHCLEKNPEERFHSASDIAFALQGLSAATSGSAAVAAMPAAARRGLLYPAIAVVALIAFAMGLLVRGMFAPAPLPRFHQITFRRGNINTARFAPDGQTVVYQAAWEGNVGDVYSGRTDSPGERVLGMPDTFVLAISSSGEMAIRTNNDRVAGFAWRGILERVPLAGGAPRPLLDDVGDASWGPTGRDIAVTRYMPATATWRLEYPIGKVLYETRGWIDAPRVAPNGDRVAFLDHPTPDGDNRGEVAVVDLAGHKKTLTRTWSGEDGLAWAPSGRELWFSASDTGSIKSLWAVSLSGGLRPWLRAPADLGLQDVSRQGQALVRKDSPHFVIEAVGPGQTHERELDWLDWSLPRQLSPDGKYILFDEEGEGGGPEYTIYMRRTDGSPAVELGHSSVIEFSPDEKWVLTRPLAANPAPLVLLPTGTGEPRQITHDQINHLDGTWFADGKRILFEGNEPGHNVRDFVLDLGTGQTRPVTPEGIAGRLLSPDGKTILLRKPDASWALWPVEGGEARAVPALGGKDLPLQWAADGKSVYLSTRDPADSFPKRKMYLLDLTTGKRRLVGSYGPADLTGVQGIPRVFFAHDGKSYAYFYFRDLSELYVVDGLK